MKLPSRGKYFERFWVSTLTANKILKRKISIASSEVAPRKSIVVDSVAFSSFSHKVDQRVTDIFFRVGYNVFTQYHTPQNKTQNYHCMLILIVHLNWGVYICKNIFWYNFKSPIEIYSRLLIIIYQHTRLSYDQFSNSKGTREERLQIFRKYRKKKTTFAQLQTQILMKIKK